MSKVDRATFLRNLTRSQIVNAIKDDIEQGESLMKEVFEHCEDDRELKIVYAEMRAIIRRVNQSPRTTP
jgi:hypothetical protein